VLTQLMNLVFVPRLAHAGLALSIGIGALINAAWLFIGLRRAGLYTPEPGWRGFALRVLLASAALGGALAWAAQALDWVAMRDQPWLRIGALAGSLVGAGLLYFGCLLAAGLKLRQFARRG
jgi:putative peptidoglycan lipid II flippase